MSHLQTSSILDTRMAKALSHPVRVKALAILQDREASPSEIAREIDVPVVNVSHHIGVLRKLGCIEQTAIRHVSGAIEHRYRFVPQTLYTQEDVTALPREGAQALASHIVETAVSHVAAALHAGHVTARPDHHLSWTPLELDEQGWATVYDLLMETLNRALQEQAASRRRVAAGESPELVRSHLTVFHYPAADPNGSGDGD